MSELNKNPNRESLTIGQSLNRRTRKEEAVHCCGEGRVHR